jgi:hypoxanthine-DNA glycosylase
LSERAVRGGAGGPARVSSFSPQVGASCRVLILGSVPSVRSLAAQQFYAHPHNLFWPFMGALFGAGPDLPYAERLARLHAAGVGLWDVLKHCERPGSLDSHIRRDSEVPNDIAGVLATHPTIAAIALNGGKAQQLFARHVAPALAPDRHAILALPSTSPANASLPRALKFERWSALQRWSKPPSGG